MALSRHPLARAKSCWDSVRRHLPPFNFIALHYSYFIGVCMVSSIIFWGSSTPPRSVTYTDSLFLSVSAMTGAGLNTVNLSQLNTFQQFILFLLIMLGSAILVSSAVVHVRRKAFESRFHHVIENGRKAQKSRRNSGLFKTKHNRSSVCENEQRSNDSGPVLGDIQQAEKVESHEHPDVRNQFSMGELQQSETRSIELPRASHILSFRLPANPSAPFTPQIHRRAILKPDIRDDPDDTIQINDTAASAYSVPPTPLGTDKYFKSEGFIGRNSQFYSLTYAERERLGGVEYRAVKLLEIIVPLYFVLWQLLGCIGLGAWIAYNDAIVTLQNGLNPWWVGAFNAVSAFNNSGMSLLDANMVAFQTSIYLLISMSLLILAGNTCYPIFLRFILWAFHRVLLHKPACSQTQSTIRFLLDHPRRCYTTLFPSKHTWWLLGTLIILNGIDWAAFEILNIGNTSLTVLPSGPRVLDGLFQAFAVRSGGFYVVNISQLRIGLLVLYVIMMYINVYPVSITMRNSNVYEERSLGIYADDPMADIPDNYSYTQNPLSILRRRLTARSGNKEPRGYFARQQLHGQLAHDLWWIVLAILFIVITETGQFEADPVDYSVFNVVFEVVSAYGCVGISVGLPNVDYSFSGGWHVLSKLILCAVMIRGRHRGLPVAIDRAVLLPGEGLGKAEEEDAQIRLERTMSRGGGASRGVSV